MKEYMHEVRTLVYVALCFWFVLYITAGSPYQKYLRLLSNLIILLMCCQLLLRIIRGVTVDLGSMDMLYRSWLNEVSGFDAQLFGR